MSDKRVLIIGSGGREHALAWKIAQSPHVSEVHVAPGNAGTSESKCRNVAIGAANINDFQRLFEYVKSEGMDMVVVGPEAPLAGGIVDFFNMRGYNRIFGPSQQATLLEADKFFSYELMNGLGIPQARSLKCHSVSDGRSAIDNLDGRFSGVVLKHRGLKEGKGVRVFDHKTQAHESLESFVKDFGNEFLVAERLYGQEFSVFALCDGDHASVLEMAVQDHKPRDDGDKGPNTGGMGAYCPVPVAGVDVVKKVAIEIMNPIVCGMKEKGFPYKGFLYAGMMMTREGPKVIEFNVRMGDPETQPAMMMLKSDLYEVLDSALEGKFENMNLEFNPGAACCVVLASKGYPGAYKKGLAIEGLDLAGIMPGIKIFHAGTKSVDGNILTNGGRVLGVTAYSEHDFKTAQRLAYNAVSKLDIEGGFQYRTDIGMKALVKL